MAKLTRFYETVSQAKAAVISSGYVEFQSEPCKGFALGDPAEIRLYGDDSVEPGANRSAILAFEVANVDAEFERLQDNVTDWVMTPTEQPWGARAISFRDPDGNLVFMFSNS